MLVLGKKNINQQLPFDLRQRMALCSVPGSSSATSFPRMSTEVVSPRSQLGVLLENSAWLHQDMQSERKQT